MQNPTAFGAINLNGANGSVQLYYWNHIECVLYIIDATAVWGWGMLEYIQLLCTNITLNAQYN